MKLQRLPRIVALVMAGLAAVAAQAQPAQPFAVHIEVDAGRSVGELKPIWRFFGADEPNCATMKDGRKLIATSVYGSTSVVIPAHGDQGRWLAVRLRADTDA